MPWNSSRVMVKKPRKRVNAVFDKQVLERARKIAGTYTFVIERDPTLGYVGWTREMPGVLADGPSVESCARAAVFAVETAVAAMIEQGETPPVSSAREKRTEQVNLRLTRSEKVLLSQESTRRGFRGLADFVRALVLEESLPRKTG